ncbi:hypothetical protein COPCOM_03397 [Coprococcus comes ATCC 27758]|uniref:Uncharacterized protein n=1 Tax=Coprococcus comes ATCC 27758 TaxID=470146 RepID=C0BDY5_9FIRM|nr:hypothetical protein COPCOM_03397 [Coprococcus comes ATCC 27758]
MAVYSTLLLSTFATPIPSNTKLVIHHPPASFFGRRWIVDIFFNQSYYKKNVCSDYQYVNDNEYG